MEARQSLQWRRREDGVTTRSGRAGSHARQLQEACSVRGDKGRLLEWDGLVQGPLLPLPRLRGSQLSLMSSRVDQRGRRSPWRELISAGSEPCLASPAIFSVAWSVRLSLHGHLGAQVPRVARWDISPAESQSPSPQGCWWVGQGVVCFLSVPERGLGVATFSDFPDKPKVWIAF